MSQFDAVLESIIKSITAPGKFQKLYDVFYNFLACFFLSIVYMNLVFEVAVPNHWCHVPGRENTSYSLEEWRDMHLPKEFDTQGKLTHSNCKMYNISNFEYENKPNDTDITTCQYGYDYDKTWYKSTIPSEQDWVCDKEIRVSNILAGSRLGKVVGSFLLGQLGDYVGRRPVYLIGLLLCLTTRIVNMFASHIYYVMLVSTTLSLFPATAAMQSLLLISMEIADADKRTGIAQIQNVAWCTSLTLLPLVVWALPDWNIFHVVSNAPLILMLCAYGTLIESPRWLANRGHIPKCVKELKKIAKVNGVKIDPEMISELQDKRVKPEKILGALSLFSSWRLARNTLIVTASSMVGSLSFFIILLNSANMEGNPFLNFMWQSVIELPAYFMGKILCDKLGRRNSGLASFIITAAMLIPVTLLIRGGNYPVTVNTFVIISKFFMGVGAITGTLQFMEIFPTCVRQSGISTGMAASGAFCIIAPYLVYFGRTVDARYPYIVLVLLNMACAICQVFLPETHHTKIPETLQEAKHFGKGQPYFYIPRKPEEIHILCSSEEITFLDGKKPLKQ